MSKSGYKIRLGGTNEFVSKIDPTWARAKVDFVVGWDNGIMYIEIENGRKNG